MKPDYQQIFVVMFYKWRSKLWDQEDLSMHYGDQGYPSTGTDYAHCRAARGGSNHPRWASGRAAARQLPQGPTKTITLPIHGNSVLSISCVLVYIPSSSTCTPSSFTGDHEGSAADVKEDKGFVPPRGYFHAPTLPLCHRKACWGGRLRLRPWCHFRSQVLACNNYYFQM